jgi:hypothetical protein
MSHCFRLSIGRVALPNRIVIAPMCQYSADDGSANDWHLMHYGKLALVRCRPADRRGHRRRAGGPHHAGLPGPVERRQRIALKRVVDAACKTSRMPLAIQLAHAGRKASSHKPWDGGQLIPPTEGGWRPWRPRRSRMRRTRRRRRHWMRPGWSASSTPSSRPRSAPCASGSMPSNCMRPTATCCTSSSRRWPTSAAMPTADRWKTACAIRWK